MYERDREGGKRKRKREEIGDRKLLFESSQPLHGPSLPNEPFIGGRLAGQNSPVAPTRGLVDANYTKMKCLLVLYIRRVFFFVLFFLLVIQYSDSEFLNHHYFLEFFFFF